MKNVENIGNKEAAAVEKKIKNASDNELLRIMDVLCAVSRCYDDLERQNIKFSIPEAVKFTASEITSRGLVDD